MSRETFMERIKQECDKSNESYKDLIRVIGVYKKELLTTNSEETILMILNDLRSVMTSFSKDSQLTDVKHIISDISKMITAVQIHDITRVDLVKMLDLLNEAANKIIHRDTANHLVLAESISPNPTKQSEENAEFFGMSM